jgi:hypothetical protein
MGARRVISQREARRLEKRVMALEGIITRQRKHWSQDYIGAEIMRCSLAEPFPSIVRTARKLGHAVVVIGDGTAELRFVALPHPSEPV